MYNIYTNYKFHDIDCPTFTKVHSFGSFDELKDFFEQLLWDCWSCSVASVAPEGGKIIYSNGDESSFVIRYNGRFCKKYSYGVK